MLAQIALALLCAGVAVVKEDALEDVVEMAASLARSMDVRGVVDVERDILLLVVVEVARWFGFW